MRDIETITWKELTGNKYSKSLHPAMLTEHGYIGISKIRRIGDVVQTLFNVIYDKEYAIGYLGGKLCKPLFGLSKEKALELVSEAWDSYYGTNRDSSDNNRIAS